MPLPAAGTSGADLVAVWEDGVKWQVPSGSISKGCQATSLLPKAKALDLLAQCLSSTPARQIELLTSVSWGFRKALGKEVQGFGPCKTGLLRSQS